MTVDVLIPTYKPGRKFAALLHMLEKQTVPPEQILVSASWLVLFSLSVVSYYL